MGSAYRCYAKSSDTLTKNSNVKLKIILYIMLKYMIKYNFIKLNFFFEWQDFCMDFNQKIRYGRDFIVSVSDGYQSYS